MSTLGDEEGSRPAGGSGLQAMTAVVRRDGDGYVINGAKKRITNARRSQLIALLRKTDTDASPRHAGIWCWWNTGRVSPFAVPCPSSAAQDAHEADVRQWVRLGGSAARVNNQGRLLQVATGIAHRPEPCGRLRPDYC